jgi:hypothetical protein
MPAWETRQPARDSRRVTCDVPTITPPVALATRGYPAVPDCHSARNIPRPTFCTPGIAAKYLPTVLGSVLPRGLIPGLEHGGGDLLDRHRAPVGVQDLADVRPERALR